MNIFPEQPKLSKADEARLMPHLGNVRTTLYPWLQTNPSTDDMKRAVLLEVKRAKATHQPLLTLKRGVLDMLIRYIQRNERGELDGMVVQEVAR